MQTQLLHLSARSRRALARRNTQERIREDVYVLEAECQEPAAVEVALERHAKSDSRATRGRS